MSPQASEAGGAGDPGPWILPPGDCSNVREAAALTLGEQSCAHGDKNDEQRVREHGAHLALLSLRSHPLGGKRSRVRKNAAKRTSRDCRTTEQHRDSDSLEAALPLPGHGAGSAPCAEGRGRANLAVWAGGPALSRVSREAEPGLLRRVAARDLARCVDSRGGQESPIGAHLPRPDLGGRLRGRASVCREVGRPTSADTYGTRRTPVRRRQAAGVEPRTRRPCAAGFRERASWRRRGTGAHGVVRLGGEVRAGRCGEPGAGWSEDASESSRAGPGGGERAETAQASGQSEGRTRSPDTCSRGWCV